MLTTAEFIDVAGQSSINSNNGLVQNDDRPSWVEERDGFEVLSHDGLGVVDQQCSLENDVRSIA